jgi:hypothetical protein|tara:strand:- start:88 stop:591 length:504 start_codon:yes stop_codon:yes gene_type:complete
MAEHNVIETLEMVDEAKTRDEKREILKSRDNYATRALLQLNFHPDVKWHIPKGSPPYTPSQEADSTEGSIHFEVKKLNYFVKGGGHDLSMLKRESMYVQLLERVAAKDAKLLISVKDQNLSYKGLSYKLVRDVWPDLLPEVEEMEDAEVVVEEKPKKKSKKKVVVET